MTLSAPDMANLFLSLAAIAGLLILQHVVTARGPQIPLNRRFLFGLRVITVLFAGRALHILTGVEFFRFFILLGAGLIPLSVLILAEGLLRRHAPPWAKVWVVSGTGLFVALSFWWSDSIDPARLIGLLVFQISGLVLGGWLIWTRDKASLSAAENQTAERLALSLVALIPMAAADFLFVYLGLPAQISPLGVLFLCWLAVSLGAAQMRHRAPLLSFLAIVVGTGVSAFVVARMAGLDRDAGVLTLAVLLAAVLVAVLWVEAQNLRFEEQSQSLLRHLAEDRSRDGLGFLRGLQSHPLVEGAAVIEAQHLADFDPAVLARIFEVRPVLRRTHPPFDGGVEGDHITHLFSLYDASHILLAGAAPLTLIALSMPSLTTSPRAELELAAVQRMAYLMSQKDAPRS